VGALAALVRAAGGGHALARPVLPPTLFVAGSIVGFLLPLLGIDLQEAAFATGALAAAMGLLLIARTTPRSPVAALLIGMAGLFQGHAAAGALGGGPPAALAACLLGLALAQAGIILAARLAAALATQPWLARAAGALILAIGITTLVPAL
jgi:hydrogenase/urease accessory protein HupE